MSRITIDLDSETKKMINSVKKSGKSKSNGYFLTLYFYKTEKKIFNSRKVIRAKERLQR